MDLLNFIKKRRANLGYSCRSFAIELGIKPSDWNGIENGKRAIPAAIVELVAAKLYGEEDSAERREFIEECLQHSPEPVKPLSEEELVQKLPMVFRKSDGTPMNEAELLRLANTLRNRLA